MCSHSQDELNQVKSSKKTPRSELCGAITFGSQEEKDDIGDCQSFLTRSKLKCRKKKTGQKSTQY